MMVYMGLDNIVHNYREPRHSRIFNSWIKYWKSGILRTQDQENEQRLLHKCKNIRFLNDEYNQTYIIAPENLEFQGPTRSNKKYCVVGQPLDRRGGDNLEPLISREINDDFVVLIKVVEQDPDMEVNIVHTSIDDDSKATNSHKEENNDKNTPKTPYDGENVNASSDDELNNYEVAPEAP